MTKPILATTEVNVLQAINLTLGTSAFLGLADSLFRLLSPGNASVAKALLISVLLFWAVKLLVENHRSFASNRVISNGHYAVFQLLMTVIMFLALTTSAKNAQDLPGSAFWLSLSLCAGIVWLAVLAGSFGRDFRWRLYPWQWVGSAAVTAVGAAAISRETIQYDSSGATVWLAAMLAAGLADAWATGTFSLTQDQA